MSIVTLLILAVAGALAAVLLLDRLGRRLQHWGATAEEVDQELPGDEWLAGGPRVRVRMTRAIDVEAPAERVWPWLAQLGRGAGWYSYDRLDNGGRTSARHLVSWIPEPRLGDAIPIGYLRHLVPGRELAWWLGGGRFFGAWLRGVTLYRVTGDGRRSRVLARMQADARGPLGRLACWLYRGVDGIMARRQLLGIRQRVERYEDRRADPEAPETGTRETGARDQYQLYAAIFASGERVGVPGKEQAVRWRRAAIEDGVLEPPAA